MTEQKSPAELAAEASGEDTLRFTRRMKVNVCCLGSVSVFPSAPGTVWEWA
jgi:hypothetical protein